MRRRLVLRGPRRLAAGDGGPHHAAAVRVRPCHLGPDGRGHGKALRRRGCVVWDAARYVYHRDGRDHRDPPGPHSESGLLLPRHHVARNRSDPRLRHLPHQRAAARRPRRHSHAQRPRARGGRDPGHARPCARDVARLRLRLSDGVRPRRRVPRRSPGSSQVFYNEGSYLSRTATATDISGLAAIPNVALLPQILTVTAMPLALDGGVSSSVPAFTRDGGISSVYLVPTP